MLDPTSEAWRLRLILGDHDPGLPAINEQRTALTHHVHPLSASRPLIARVGTPSQQEPGCHPILINFMQGDGPAPPPPPPSLRSEGDQDSGSNEE